jgi:hypothetical protein
VSDQLTLETTSTASSLVPPAPSRRRYARSPLDSTAQLKSVPHKTWQKIRVVDISENGARIECQDDMRLSVGESIILNIPSLPGRPQKNVVLRGTVHRDYLSYRFGVSFDALVNEQIDNRAARGSRILAVSAALLAATAILYLKSRNVTSYWYGPLIQTYSIMAAIYLMSRVVISAFYKAPRDNGYTPTVSLIVAVKNEEAHIAETVAHCFRTRYPVDKFELIVVDDGSTDDTWKVLTDLQKKYDSRFRCFQFPENRGKRHAMALGTRVAKGDFLVFIDSDTFLEEEAIYRLVQPFHDPRVGAVAGHTLVIVEEGNIISKMESVRYFVSQRIMKAAESVFNAVTCCSRSPSPAPRASSSPWLVVTISACSRSRMPLRSSPRLSIQRPRSSSVLSPTNRSRRARCASRSSLRAFQRAPAHSRHRLRHSVLPPSVSSRLRRMSMSRPLRPASRAKRLKRSPSVSFLLLSTGKRRKRSRRRKNLLMMKTSGAACHRFSAASDRRVDIHLPEHL